MSGTSGERSEHATSLAPAPWWFEQGLIVVCATVLAWGAAGVALAYRGDYSIGAAAAFGTAGTVFGVAAAIVRPRPERIRAATGPAVAMVLSAAAIGAWNAEHAGHHVVADRDPGVYMLAGKWIATHGSLVVPAGAGWPTNIASLAFSSGGSYNTPGRTTQFQFAHFLPALLAEAQNIGGDGLMFRTNALLGALSLLVLFAVGCRLCKRPWLVVAALVGLGISIPEINCVRDTFSEPSTQFVLWTGIWLIVVAVEARSGWRHLGVAVLGGAALGAAVMTRIDGVAYLIFVPLLAALGLLARSGTRRQHLLVTYAAIAVGAIPTVVIGTLDVQHRAGRYYHDLHHNMMSLYRACFAMTLVAIVLLLVWPLSGALRGLAARWRTGAATGAAGVAVVGMVLAWTVRPAVQTLRWPAGPSSLPYVRLNTSRQMNEGLPIDGLRTYGERSVVWLTWYLGPVAVVLAIVGLGFLVSRLIRNPTPVVAVALLVAGALAAEYLWNPHVNGDQPWAMRRLLPSVLPLCALLAAVGTARACEALNLAIPRFRATGIAAVCGVALVAFPLGTTTPVRDLSTDQNFSAAVRQVCARVGPKAAILTVSPSLGRGYTQSFRSWCNVPAAGINAPIDRATVGVIARNWKRQGRTLWVLSNDVPGLQALVPTVRPQHLATAIGRHEVEVTLSRPPQQYKAKGVTFWALAI